MILVKTEAGQQALKDRSAGLTPRQRSAFILFDGRRSVSEVLASGMGIGEQDIEQMLQLGLLGQVGGSGAAANAASAHISLAAVPAAQAPATPVAVQAASVTAVAPAAPVTAAQTPRTPQERYQAAYPIATKLTAGLGLRGFRLNLQVEGTSNYDELLALAPKIRAAVGADKAADLDRALED